MKVVAKLFRLNIALTVLVLGSVTLGISEQALAQATGPVVMFQCVDGNGVSFGGEQALKVCTNTQFPNYSSSPYQYVLGGDCTSPNPATLAASPVIVQAHFVLLKDSPSSIIRVCRNMLTISSSTAVIATTSQVFYSPQNCGYVLEGGAILRSMVGASGQSMNCSFTFDLTGDITPVPAGTPTPSRTPTRSATVTATRTVTRTPTPISTPTRTRTATPVYSSSSSQFSSASSSAQSSSTQGIDPVID